MCRMLWQGDLNNQPPPLHPGMRPFTRQSSRLANTSRIRQTSTPRHRIERQRRPFTSTAVHLDDSRPPDGPPSRHTPLNEPRQPQRNTESGREQGDGIERDNGEAKSGIETPKSGGRRPLRQRRLESVPRPPPIPDWFLRHNVRLIEERVKVKGVEEEKQTIRCVDTETGHTLFAVERYNQTPQDKKRLSLKKKPRSAEGETQVASSLPHETSSVEQSKPSTDDTKAELDSSFFEQKYAALASDSIAGTIVEQSEDAYVGPEYASEADKYIAKNDWRIDPMGWPFLEAETTIRAAFSIADGQQPLSKFATDRVDVSLQCPDPNSHEQMDGFVRDLAAVLNADVIQLDANDFEELMDEYVGQGDDKPGSYSNLAYDVFEDYVATAVGSKSNAPRAREDEDENEDDFDEDDDPPVDDNRSPRFLFDQLLNGGLGNIDKLRVGGGRLGIAVVRNPSSAALFRPAKATSAVSDSNRDERLNALFDSLLSAASEKRDKLNHFKTPSEIRPADDPTGCLASWHNMPHALKTTRLGKLRGTTRLLLTHLRTLLGGEDATKFAYQLLAEKPAQVDTEDVTEPLQRRTIVYVRDMEDLQDTALGHHILRRLSKIVMKRRRSGERIVIVGATAADVPGPEAPRTADEREYALPARTIQVSPFFNFTSEDGDEFFGSSPKLDERNLDKTSYSRILEINIRHIQSMLRRMRPSDDISLTSPAARKQMNLPTTHFLSERVLPIDQVQRLALLVVGLSEYHAKAEKVQPVHVGLAALIAQRSDHVNRSWSLHKDRTQKQKPTSDAKDDVEPGYTKPDGQSGQTRIDRVKKSCNSHETKLFHGVVDSSKIKTGYTDVHAPAETVEALKSLTSLSLLRPDAFKYGVLANDRLPGLLLYGPPGTGKTLLAKAVAKESKATVLEVSGAEVYDKYVGEGEKMVRAVFSLAKKLSPCVVFIDEADAIFGSRGNEGNRTTHRDIINQFLRQWDGMDDHGVFMMVATNRPFDLDDAVLRRLPRRLLVDLPVAKDRESILGIHLREEALDPAVSLGSIAERTPYYSGSDLKNLSVAAALACVREENELKESKKGEEGFKLPEKRTLMARHFEKALTEISASISEDMGSLSKIRKFDEQYGDRRGRRKKTGYGFGMSEEVDERVVMVRQGVEAAAPPA